MGNSKVSTLTATTTPTKLVKRKSFGFVHLGRGFGGHGGGENEVVGDIDEVEGEGKQDVIGREDRMKYAGLGLGRANVRGGGDESESTPKNENRNRRRSLSRLLLDRDKEKKDTDVDGRLEKENDNEQDHPKEIGKEGTRSFMGSVRRISLVSVGVVGRHKKTKSGAGGFSFGGDSLAPIPPVPTSLPPALSCASQVSLRIPSSTAAATNTNSHQRNTSSRISTSDLRRAASLSSPSGGGGSGDPTGPSVPVTPVTPVRSPSGSHHSRPPSISSTKKRRRTLSKPRSKPRKSEESSQEVRDGGLKPSLDFQQEPVPSYPSDQRDNTLLPTPTQSAFSTTAADIPIPLLPPIELQPPSPPHTATTRHAQRRSRAYTTNELVEGLETLVVTRSTSPSLGFFTPTSSFSRDNVGSSAIGVGGILPLPPLSPSKLSPGKSPQSQQSVSLGRSTAVNVAAAAGNESTGSGGAGGLPRRNSLGDLKIPARISQAQVGLRRDLGMVREFASNVEREFLSCFIRLF
jgi:hypothetical protein